MSADEARKKLPARIVAMFDTAANWTPEEIALCLEYLAEVYREHGGTGLRVIRDDEEASDDVPEVR